MVKRFGGNFPDFLVSSGMRISAGYLPALVFLCCATDGRAQFQGRIVSDNMTIDETGSAARTRMTVTLGASAGRIETSTAGGGPATVMIARKQEGVLWILDSASMSYQEVRRARLPAVLPDSVKPVPGKMPGAMRRSGRKGKHLGYPCEEVVMKQGGLETRLMVTDRLPDLAGTMHGLFDSGEVPAAGEGIGALYDAGWFPLTSASSLEGNVIESQQVVLIERLVPDPSLFQLPSGYRKRRPPGTDLPPPPRDK